ncbi:ATP-binding protein [Streptosporangium sp. NBC_01756]|uniref:ATP-binding protein n=1 Tax=Streptosporangium sp. NBC_01756 TaxID=2975950 RepID=UPI002DD8FE30|nr:ATP-binding protein [Streptosporangium sp. NBC_01756]WSC88501.1 ATP-binding protein [Streptosporangium sp. NBC_01756]
MRKVHIEAKPDHLLRLARLKDPVGAVTEMIWNALDAEACHISVDIDINELGGVESVSVTDNGHGMPNASCGGFFGGLGGSWKIKAKVSSELKRGLHGRSGQGRLRAFALGEQVRWVTVAQALDGRAERTVISGAIDRPADFDISEPDYVNDSPGTRVEALVPADFVTRLVQDDTAQQLASTFAPFLAANPDVRITYQGKLLDPATVWADMAQYPVPWPDFSGLADPLLRVIEWPKDVGRVLALCDDNGVVLDEVPPGIQAPGYHFTAYLLWDGFVERRGDLPLAEMDEIAGLLEVARETLRGHFKERDRERRARLIQEWKREEVYPYSEEPAEPAQAVERQMFDEVATTIARRLPGSQQSRKTTLRLLREIISHDPNGLYPMLDELFRLPQSEQEELKRLLQRTSLSEVIKATGQVADRLDFVAALKKLVFEPEVSRTVKERSELHKILERETWIFGDAYGLMVSDQSLDAVLDRHLKALGREPEGGLSDPVRREDGRQGIVDLMLGRAHRGSAGREHLVVELKAPKVKIGQTEVGQIKSYAQAVVSDPQFRDARVAWDFWVLSTEMDDVVRRDATAPNRPPGCIAEWEGGVRIWARTWSEIIDDCEDRLHFYRDRLNHDPATEHAMEYLKRVHGTVMPETVARP